MRQRRGREWAAARGNRVVCSREEVEEEEQGDKLARALGAMDCQAPRAPSNGGGYPAQCADGSSTLLRCRPQLQKAAPPVPCVAVLRIEAPWALTHPQVTAALVQVVERAARESDRTSSFNGSVLVDRLGLTKGKLPSPVVTREGLYIQLKLYKAFTITTGLPFVIASLSYGFVLGRSCTEIYTFKRESRIVLVKDILCEFVT